MARVKSRSEQHTGGDFTWPGLYFASMDGSRCPRRVQKRYVFYGYAALWVVVVAMAAWEVLPWGDELWAPPPRRTHLRLPQFSPDLQDYEYPGGTRGTQRPASSFCCCERLLSTTFVAAHLYFTRF